MAALGHRKMRAFFCDTRLHITGNVFAEHVFVVDDFHAAFRHRDAEVIHHLAEQVAVFGDIDGVDARAENLHAFIGEGAGDVQRSLATELHDDASRLLTPSASAASPRS